MSTVDDVSIVKVTEVATEVAHQFKQDAPASGPPISVASKYPSRFPLAVYS
jgi:hypothetical protein